MIACVDFDDQQCSNVKVDYSLSSQVKSFVKAFKTLMREVTRCVDSDVWFQEMGCVASV